MKLEYIKANGTIYRPMEKGVQDHELREGYFYDVCFIKKLPFGIFRVDYYDEHLQYLKKGSATFDTNQTPNSRIYIYPAGIEEIKYWTGE